MKKRQVKKNLKKLGVKKGYGLVVGNGNGYDSVRHNFNIGDVVKIIDSEVFLGFVYYICYLNGRSQMIEPSQIQKY